MKKLLSVLLSVMMLFAVATSFAVPALAADTVKSPSGDVVEEEGKDDDKSPSTGAAGIVFAATAAAGSALVLIKKKNDAE